MKIKERIVLTMSLHCLSKGTQWNQDLLICDFAYNVNCQETSLCSSKPVAGDKTVYDKFGADYTWTTMSCPTGYAYNDILCSCADKIVVPVKHSCLDRNMKAIPGDKSGYLQVCHAVCIVLTTFFKEMITFLKDKGILDFSPKSSTI